MNKRTLLSLLLLLAITTVACTCNLPGLSDLLNSASTSSSSQPTVSATGNDQNTANVLYFDDFSDPQSGWDRVHDGDNITDYYQGQYRILVQETQTDLWANPSQSFPADVIVEVQAVKNSGPDDNDFGVLCRYQGVNNYVFFIISSDGYAGIGKVENGSQNLLNPDQAMVPVEGIPTGANAIYHIRAACVGNNLTLYVNGQKIMEAQDPAPTAGDVGLMAGTFDTPGTDILFDDFRVLSP